MDTNLHTHLVDRTALATLAAVALERIGLAVMVGRHWRLVVRALGGALISNGSHSIYATLLPLSVSSMVTPVPALNYPVVKGGS